MTVARSELTEHHQGGGHDGGRSQTQPREPLINTPNGEHHQPLDLMGIKAIFVNELLAFYSPTVVLISTISNPLKLLAHNPNPP